MERARNTRKNKTNVIGGTKVKFYDKEMYEKENFIKGVLTIIIAFLIGLSTGFLALYDEIQFKEQTITNQSAEINRLQESEENR